MWSLRFEEISPGVAYNVIHNPDWCQRAGNNELACLEWLRFYVMQIHFNEMHRNRREWRKLFNSIFITCTFHPVLHIVLYISKELSRFPTAFFLGMRAGWTQTLRMKTGDRRQAEALQSYRWNSEIEKAKETPQNRFEGSIDYRIRESWKQNTIGHGFLNCGKLTTTGRPSIFHW